MRQALNIVFGLFALGLLLYSFVEPGEGTKRIFGFTVNIWLYRLFWGLITASILSSAYRDRKKIN